MTKEVIIRDGWLTGWSARAKLLLHSLIELSGEIIMVKMLEKVGGGGQL